MISVVIATCNRPNLCKRLIKLICAQSVLPKEVIIVDSSDLDNRLDIKEVKKPNMHIRYIQTQIKSAAIQRNIAFENLSKKTEFIVVLDDDVVINSQYIQKLIDNFKDKAIVGVSGVAVNLKHEINRNKFKFIKKLFFFESDNSGVITLGGINIPILKNISNKVIQSEWLIGCSIWRYTAVKNIRYQSNFYGQSLFEDVIFSIKAREKGKLVVDTSIIFEHEESKLERPNQTNFYKMWIFNRYFVVLNLDESFTKYLAFHWTNLGKIFQVFFEMILLNKESFFKFVGICLGYLQLLRYMVYK